MQLKQANYVGGGGGGGGGGGWLNLKPLILLLKHGRQGPRLESYKQEDELVLDDKEEWKINLSGCIINDDRFCLTVM